MKQKLINVLLPVKSNNERLPGKNTVELGGVPLINHSINTCIQSKLIDRIYIFASDISFLPFINADSEKIVFLERPKFLNSNETSINSVVKKFLEGFPFRELALIHCTSPFISLNTLDKCISAVIYEGFDSAYAAREVKKFMRYRGKPVNYNEGKELPRLQDIEPVIEEQGGLYVFKTELLIKHNRRIGQKSTYTPVTQFEAVDIDTEEDLQIARLLIRD